MGTRTVPEDRSLVVVHWRTGLSFVPALIGGLVLAGFCLFSMGIAERASVHMAALNRQLDAAEELNAATADFALRVAQVIHEGRDPQGDLRAARLGMERGFLRLTQEAREQAAAAAGGAETRTLLVGVEQARRMLELYHSIDLSAARAFVLKRDGRTEEALEVYRREVDFRLATELATLLHDATANAAQRSQAARTAADDTALTAQNTIYALTALFIATLLASGFLLFRHGQKHQPELAAAFEERAEELRQANRLLRETDRRRAQFLADVSHELRTPLTILRGEADVALLPGSAPDERQRSLERIQDQAAELAQLLDDLIAFARSDAEPQALSLNRLLLDDLLAAAVEEGETLAEPREVTIALGLLDKGQWIDADGRRLKQALIIGLDNAINHSPPGSQIAVQLTRMGELAQVAIMDRGTGLPEADAARVFDRFYRGGNATGSFGLGIGLAIAKGIVEQHAGTIALSNRDGGGAVLTIALPLPKEPRP